MKSPEISQPVTANDTVWGTIKFIHNQGDINALKRYLNSGTLTVEETGLADERLKELRTENERIEKHLGS